MTAYFKWDSIYDNTVYLTFDGRWTVEDFVQIVGEASQLTNDHAKNSINVIVDVTTSAGMPKGSNMVPHFKRLFSLEVFDRVVVVGASAFGRVLLQTLTKIFSDWRDQLIFTDTVDEAYRQLGYPEKRAL